MTFEQIRARAAVEGLAVTGWMRSGPEDGAPERARALLLLGYGGPELWTTFTASEEARDGAPHPLDRWSIRVITALAEDLGATPLFPFGGPPYQPFFRWIMKAERAHGSRLGMAIHEERGLWCGWRGALAFADDLNLPEQRRGPNPCDPCAAPCRAACPVGAFSDAGYDVDACRAHLNAPEGAPCRAQGCLARRACPVGRDYAHSDEQAAFHLEAFRIA